MSTSTSSRSASATSRGHARAEAPGPDPEGQAPGPDPEARAPGGRRAGVRLDDQGSAGAWQTLRRGLAMAPELRTGLTVTLLLALVATAGKVVVPVAVQQTIDVGLLGPDGPRVGFVATAALVAAGVLAVTSAAHYGMTARLVRATEATLANLRVRAFRHVHDLSMLHQAAEQRGALVSRVTSDIDQISRFMQWGGVIMLVSLGQLVLASVAMVAYSPLLALVVIGCFAPLALVIRWFQKRLSAAYDTVRRKVAALMSSIAESVAGAPVVRAYGITERTNARIGRAVEEEFHATYRAGRLAAGMFASGEAIAGIATAAVIVVGVPLGLAGGLAPEGEPWVGRLAAFIFLVNLFVQPMQVATEVLDQAQKAIAGWRRVIAILDAEPDVADPDRHATIAGTAGVAGGGSTTGAGGARGADGAAGNGADPANPPVRRSREIPPGPVAVRFERVTFQYPTGPPVLHDIDVEIPAQGRIAIVGETGSGKTTFVKLLTRLMDPTEGEVRINGVPLPDVGFASLRERVVMVPQDGFLFDASIADNVRYGRPRATDEDVEVAFGELGLAAWLESLPDGPSTPVGERGESLSTGERQLVALARAYVADPDLLVLDEATSAVDPATEARIQRALDSVTHGRTSIAIAHRLSTAEAADEVIVFDAGRIVQRGPHRELAADPGGVYAGLHASWVSGTSGTSGAIGQGKGSPAT